MQFSAVSLEMSLKVTWQAFVFIFNFSGPVSSSHFQNQKLDEKPPIADADFTCNVNKSTLPLCKIRKTWWRSEQGGLVHLLWRGVFAFTHPVNKASLPTPSYNIWVESNASASYSDMNPELWVHNRPKSENRSTFALWFECFSAAFTRAAAGCLFSLWRSYAHSSLPSDIQCAALPSGHNLLRADSRRRNVISHVF